MRMILVDDGRHELGPMTDLRAVFELRTGIRTTAERLARLVKTEPAGCWVPQHLAELVRSRVPYPVNELPGSNDHVTLVNGRWVTPGMQIAPHRDEVVVDADGVMLVASLRAQDAMALLETGEMPKNARCREALDEKLIAAPWDVMRLLPDAMAMDFHDSRIAEGAVFGPEVFVIGDQPLEVDAGARVYPGVTFDVEHGPILVEADAVIRPGAILCGPCAIGRGTTVMDRAHIKAGTSIGPVCKVGGEVGGTIFQGFANKSHEGHLGDSWVGEWVNIGAGTTNSNLLNTYGEIMMRTEPDGQRRRTGLRYLGSIIGDHVKLAICTRLMTGTVLGTGAMIASSTPPPVTVDRFAWMTDEGQRRYRLDKFLEVARTMMSRRAQTLEPVLETAITELYERHNTGEGQSDQGGAGTKIG